jgi:hypothetical protein
MTIKNTNAFFDEESVNFDRIEKKEVERFP